MRIEIPVGHPAGLCAVCSDEAVSAVGEHRPFGSTSYEWDDKLNGWKRTSSADDLDDLAQTGMMAPPPAEVIQRVGRAEERILGAGDSGPLVRARFLVAPRVPVNAVGFIWVSDGETSGWRVHCGSCDPGSTAPSLDGVPKDAVAPLRVRGESVPAVFVQAPSSGGFGAPIRLVWVRAVPTFRGAGAAASPRLRFQL